MPSLRPILRTLLISIVVAYGLLCLGLYLGQERLVFVPDKLPADYTFDFPGMQFDEVRVPSGDVVLSALHFNTPNPKGVVLYFHGNAGSLRLWGGIAPIFTRRNYDLFVVDYRGYGKSTGALQREDDLHADARAVYDHVRQQFAAEQIIVFGRSLGSGVAARLAAERPARMLILETPYISLREVVTDRVPFVPVGLLLKYPLLTEDWIAQVRCPVYLFHGTADNTVPYNHSVRLLGLIQAPRELITLPDGGHGNLASFPAYQQKMIELLSQF